MTDPLLEAEKWQSLMEGLLRSKYQVLIGAGFSAAVLDRRGSRLPLADALTSEIVDEFALPVSPGESISLARAYDAADRRSSRDGLSRSEWLTRRFTRTEPPSWISTLWSLPVEKIWTLNIDDALERSGGKRVRSRSYLDANESTSKHHADVIHLHGRATEPDSLIFSLSEYRGSILSPRSYALQFSEALSDSPVIVIGASLSSELDLVHALRDRARGIDSRWPSVLIKKDPTEFEVEEYRSWGLEVVGATAQDFLEAVKESLREAQTLVGPILAAENKVSPSTIAFNKQWQRIGSGQGSLSRYRDFLAGSEPMPSDVANGQTIRRDVLDHVISSLKGGKGPVLIHGIPFSGKSTLALSALVQLEKDGWNVYAFNGDERLDAEAALWACSVEPHTVLFIDDAGLAADGIRELLDLASERGARVRLLCCDRTGPASRLRRWAEFPFVEIAMNGVLSEGERDRFIELLKRKDRLNKEWRGVPTEKISERTSRAGWRDFSSLICELVIGEQFEDRVRRDYRSLTGSNSRALYFLGSVLTRTAKGIPIGFASNALGLTGAQVEGLVADLSTMDSICWIQGGKVRPRHRRHAEILLDNLVPKNEAFAALVALALAVAPSLNVEAIRMGTIAYKISVAVMDSESLSEWVGPSRLEDFYAATEEAFAWNSRYWEQRALAASKSGRHEDASHFARRALAAHRDAFSLNTSATVRFRRASVMGLQSEDGRREFWSAVDDVRTARDMARPDSEYPYITFFNNAIRYASSLGLTDKGGLVDLEQEFLSWSVLADRSEAFRDPIGIEKLEKIKLRWARSRA